MSGTWAQLRTLVAMRWRMVRSARARRLAKLLGAAVGLLFALAIAGGRLLPGQQELNAAALFPTTLFAYAALAVVGPLTTGGGNELFPSDEVVPHPIRPATTFAGSLILAPLNIAWLGQTAGLMALAAYVADSWHGVPASCGLTFFYAVVVTVAGQAVGWWLAGLSHTPRGRRVVIALAVAVGIGVAVVLRIGLTKVLDRAPTRSLALAILLAARGTYGQTLASLAVLIAIAVAAVAAGPRGVAFAQRQPPGVNAERSARTVARRPPRRSAGAELTATDRASIWRSPPLRRGVLVLGLLPGAAAAAFRVDWPGLALVAGLVTAGAGLLFGINAFSLDGAGSLWLASNPVERRTRLLSKLRVVVEVCLVASVIAVLAGVSRIRGEAGFVVALNVVVCAAACTAVVAARCMRSSVVRPHRADLRGSRDTPAPHGAMAAESATLAALTTTTSLVITGFAAVGSAAGVLLVGGATIALAARSIIRTVRMFENPRIGSIVAVTVATG